MKNIIIAGPSRTGKSSLARKISEELNCFVINIDKLVAAFQEAYPQLDIRLNWDRQRTTDNIAPFLGHFLGVFSSPDGRGLLPYSHGAAGGTRFVLEGGYLSLEKILPILKSYGIEALADSFLLIGLVQNNKTADELVNDFKRYDTHTDWTYGFSDDDLMEISKDILMFSQSMSDDLARHGFAVYDTSGNREQILVQIVEDINVKLISEKHD